MGEQSAKAKQPMGPKGKDKESLKKRKPRKEHNFEEELSDISLRLHWIPYKEDKNSKTFFPQTVEYPQAPHASSKYSWILAGSPECDRVGSSSKDLIVLDFLNEYKPIAVIIHCPDISHWHSWFQGMIF